MTQTREQKAQRLVGETNWEQRKRNSWMACLERMAPGLLSERKATMTETRAEKAQRLVDEGRVKIWGETEHGIHAYVLDGSNTHFVILYPRGEYFCEYRGNHFHSHTDDPCVHALAVKLAMEKEGVK